jgi:starch-binding outer membrane protein, SusD/RagB family
VAFAPSWRAGRLPPPEGRNGQPFVSAGDPRVEVSDEGTSSFDFSTELYAPVKYSAYTAPVPYATGVEARLIQAEAQYKAGSYTTALQTLNDLRATQGMDPLVPALTPTAQEDQIFAERAFWLFGTAHRLGDLRRLVKQYGRGAETVFPTGAYFKGGAYSTQVTLRVPQQEEQDNPNYSRAACDPTKA